MRSVSLIRKSSAARKRASVLVALTHETLNAGTFESIADLSEAIKTGAGRLGIPYTAGIVAAAIRAVGARRPLLKENR